MHLLCKEGSLHARENNRVVLTGVSRPAGSDLLKSIESLTLISQKYNDRSWLAVVVRFNKHLMTAMSPKRTLGLSMLRTGYRRSGH